MKGEVQQPALLSQQNAKPEGAEVSVKRNKLKTKLYIAVTERALVTHTFVFAYMRGFGYYILFWACRKEGNRCENTEDN